MAAYFNLTKNLMAKSKTTTQFVRFCSKIPDKLVTTETPTSKSQETLVSKSEDKPNSSSQETFASKSQETENPTEKAVLGLFGLKYQGLGLSWRKTSSGKDLPGEKDKKDGDGKKTQEQQEMIAKRLYSAFLKNLKKKLASYAEGGKSLLGKIDNVTTELGELFFTDIEHKKLSPALVKALEKEIQKKGGLYQVFRDALMETLREMWEDEVMSKAPLSDDDPQEMVDYVEIMRVFLEDVRVVKAAAENPREFLNFLRELLILFKSRIELLSPVNKVLLKGVGRLMKKFVAADYIELSHLLNLLDFSSPLISPLFTKSAEPNIMVKPLKNGLLITVDAIGFTRESDLQIKMEHGCVLIKGEASTVKGDKVVNEVVPIGAEIKYDPSEVTAQLIGGVVLVFVPNGSKEEGKDMCVNVVWGDVMKLIAI